MEKDTREEESKKKEEDYRDLDEVTDEGSRTVEVSEPEESTGKLDELEEELAEKEETIQDLKDRIRHLKADFENYKKRQGKKTEEKIKKARGELITEIVPIYDNLDRAFKSFEKNDDEESFIEGVEKIYAQFDEFLSKQDVELIKAEGEKFDPNKHEALMRVESDKHEHNEITEEFERGYRYKNEVLKPSKVKVNINPSPNEGENNNNSSEAN
ncbi:nucleotide exchange factor GrpE [Candidatus Bipolaricaulota bacterium]|nr:nucleotide exchange factor GrpE [Candidatus Bipolaricaulota bacterium]